ncbi:MAG: hypothetical protein LBF22_14310 [Deltaproteobacteria bacterium]|nr:hypothetical protein [Deltaproteobacteria bacterium]
MIIVTAIFKSILICVRINFFQRDTGMTLRRAKPASKTLKKAQKINSPLPQLSLPAQHPSSPF